MNIGEKILISIMSVLLGYVLILLVVIAAAKVDCLENGYPETTITWNLKTYCINLDGVVVGKVVNTVSLEADK